MNKVLQIKNELFCRIKKFFFCCTCYTNKKLKHGNKRHKTKAFDTNSFAALQYKTRREQPNKMPFPVEIVLFFDGDKAGTEAVKEIAAELKQINQALQISVVETPKGEDVNSLAQGHENEMGVFK